MIIPALDIMAGQAVQLVGGEHKLLDLGDPLPLAERLRLAGEIAVVDLDAALGRGSNAELLRKLLRIAPCRVGGGIRDAESAVRWLDAGATRVVLGTAAVPEVLTRLPARRVMAALDARDDEVVVDGWRRRTGVGVVERMRQLEGLVSSFLVTFVELEGRLAGTAPLARIARLVEAAGKARLTVAGGVVSAAEVGEIDRAGADVQVGMALHSGRLELAEAIAAPLSSDRPDGLWPTLVVDQRGLALGLAYSNLESLREALRSRRGVYHSRRRGRWRKGDISGATQELLRVDVDCDRDTLRFVVRQHGEGFCHLGTRTCFGEEGGWPALARRLDERRDRSLPESYTGRLLRDPDLLRAKLLEEAGELADAATPAEVAAEAADLIYFASVAMSRARVSIEDVETVLDQRALCLSRRPGDAKLGTAGGGGSGVKPGA